jgi:hypothetical protein
VNAVLDGWAKRPWFRLFAYRLLNDIEGVEVGIVRLFALATVQRLVPGLLERSGIDTSSLPDLFRSVKRGEFQTDPLPAPPQS